MEEEEVEAEAMDATALPIKNDLCRLVDGDELSPPRGGGTVSFPRRLSSRVPSSARRLCFLPSEKSHNSLVMAPIGTILRAACTCKRLVSDHEGGSVR